MPTVEYYYPLTTLTVKSNNGELHFSCEENQKVNFATPTIKGTAVAYYIKSISDADRETMTFGSVVATKYLVIEHTNVSNVSDKFNVAIPLCEVGNDISKYTKRERLNGKLSMSIENLSKSNSGSKVRFSLEHVIASMVSFKPDGYYKVTDRTTTPNKITYVLKAPIYISTDLSKTPFYGGPSNIVIGQNPTLTVATINRVTVKTQCSKPKSNKKQTEKKIFNNLSAREQRRINLLNMIYGISAILGSILFYYINSKYLDPRSLSFIVACVILGLSFLLIIPVSIVVSKYNKNRIGKIDVTALRESVMFSIYFGLWSLLALYIIFSSSIMGIITTINKSGFIDFLKTAYSSLLGDDVKTIVKKVIFPVLTIILIVQLYYIAFGI